jgi:hypothetical protein
MHSTYLMVDCSANKLLLDRRELTQTEQLSYIDAVLCLQSAPPQTTDLYSVQSRYDDFVALHIALTQYIHWVVSSPALTFPVSNIIAETNIYLGPVHAVR